MVLRIVFPTRMDELLYGRRTSPSWYSRQGTDALRPS